MSTKSICDRCGEPIVHDLHQVRLILVNASKTAPIENVDVTGDYHHACAAYLFHAARGRET